MAAEFDAGDLPAPFPTLIADNGPTHTAIGPMLGAQRDIDADGQPTSGADGDDTTGSPDDEDGVTFDTVAAAALAAEVSVVVTDDAKLDAWIDFNGDGTFNGSGEQIFRSVDVIPGENVLRFEVPADARTGSTFARFRVSTAGGLSPVGAAADGEVEDHALTIVASPRAFAALPSSSAVSDSFNTTGAKLGDLDGDGDLDAFSVNDGEGNRVYLNDGAGAYSDTGQALGGTNSSQSVALGDLDGDGDLDAIVGNAGANKVWINDGSGTFTDSDQSLGDGDSRGVALGDLDSDGDLDAVVANADQGDRIYFNDGLGNFTAASLALGGTGSQAAELGDLDRDGDLDLFVAVDGAGNLVYRNDGAGNFSDSGQALGTGSSQSVALGDLDGDGDLDAVVGNDNG